MTKHNIAYQAFEEASRSTFACVLRNRVKNLSRVLRWFLPEMPARRLEPFACRIRIATSSTPMRVAWVTSRAQRTDPAKAFLPWCWTEFYLRYPQRLAVALAPARLQSGLATASHPENRRTHPTVRSFPPRNRGARTCSRLLHQGSLQN